MKYVYIIATAAVVLTAAGCQEQKKEAQYQLCETHSYNEAIQSCKEGQLVSVLPNRWGSEQFPLVIASVVCDFDHPVVHTTGGVVCVFTKKRWDNFVADQAKQNKQSEQAAEAKR